MSFDTDHFAKLHQFCSFCLRERPPNVEFYKHVIGSTQEMQRSLQTVLGYDFNLTNFAICKSCWKMMQLIQDFRLRCFKANEVAEQISRGLTTDGRWFSTKNLATIESVRMSIKDQLEQIVKVNVTEGTPMPDDSGKVVSEHQSITPQPVEDISQDQSEKEVAARTKTSNRFECKKCSRPFTRLGFLVRHTDICGTHKPTVFTCHLCFQVLPSQKALDEHIEGHPFRAALNCRMYCEDHFFTEEDRTRHEQVCIETPQSCMICGAVQQNKETLRAHFRKVHPGERTFACKNCGKRFRRKDTMLLHERTVHTENKYIFPCPECGKMFTRRENVLIHAKKFHPKVAE